MRVKRHKDFRRSLQFYRLAYGVTDPYKVLVDGTFLCQALREKLHVKEQLPKMLGGKNVTPMTTGCVVAELRSLRDQGIGAAIIAKSYYRLKCKHEKPVGAAECILDQIGAENSRKFMVATQDVSLAQALRAIPGVPLIRMNQQVPLLEEPSYASKSANVDEEKRKLEAAAWEKQKLPELREKVKEEKAKEKDKAKAKAKKKGPKGANPLSCMKTKKKQAPGAGGAAQAPEQPAVKPKRVRSRRMGTRTREEAERLALAQEGGAESGRVAVAGSADQAARDAQREAQLRMTAEPEDRGVPVKADEEAQAASAPAEQKKKRRRKK